ncbi:MAG: glycosyltransferase family 4 protein [Gaiellaceae bacterium]
MSVEGCRPRLLVFNQYYWPGLEATAHLLAELCGALADEFDITVVTGRILIHAPEAGRSVHEGVEVIRVKSTAFDRRRLYLRALNYLTYMVESMRAGFRARRPDVVLCMTDPPIIGNIALLVARRFGAPLVVISQDVFPEIAVEVKRLENKPLIALLRVLIAIYLRGADQVVAIGDTMRKRLEAKGACPARITVIPNWVDTTAVYPTDRKNAWSQAQALDGRFVVMHSGNVGHAQDLEALIRATTFVRDLDDLALVIIGGGARLLELKELAEVLEADRIQFMGYQSRETLSMSLSTASIHFVGLGSGLSGYVVPSRLYGILAAGRPVLVSADPDSETAMVVERVGCGIVISPGRPELVAKVLRDAHDGRYDLDEMGRRGREFVVAEADRTVAVHRYRELLRAVARS